MSLLANLNARSHGEPLIGEQSTTMSISQPASGANGVEDHTVSRLSRFQTATVLSDAQAPGKAPNGLENLETDSEVVNSTEDEVEHIVVGPDVSCRS